MVFLKTLKLTIVDYWWKGRKLDKKIRKLSPSPLKWFFQTYRILLKYWKSFYGIKGE